MRLKIHNSLLKTDDSLFLLGDNIFVSFSYDREIRLFSPGSSCAFLSFKDGLFLNTPFFGKKNAWSEKDRLGWFGRRIWKEVGK